MARTVNKIELTVNVRAIADLGKVVEQIHNASQRNPGVPVTIFVNGEGFEAPQDGSAGKPRKPDETPEERKERRRMARRKAEAGKKEEPLDTSLL